MPKAPIVTTALLLTGFAAVSLAVPSLAEPPPPARSRSAVVAHAVKAVEGHRAALHAGSGQSYKAGTVLADGNGTTHTRFTRGYRGLKVLGGDFVVHESAKGGWLGVSQTLKASPAISLKPSISAKTAVRAAKTAGHSRYGKAALLIDARSGKPVLAYAVTAYGKQKDGTPSELAVTVNARTGKVITREERIETVDGSGSSLYSGAVTLSTTLSGSTYQLKDTTRGGFTTRNLANGTSGTGSIFTDADNAWGTGTTSSTQTAAVDAHYGAQVTWDFYKNTFGRNGIDNAGTATYNRVHYGSAYANAFWSDSCFCMTYGDGDTTNLGPLVSLDVAGHEMSHGVTSRTANLTYSGESGGLNEATSDIFGTMVEFYAANAKDVGDYLIGEKIVRSGLGRDALRYMDKPSKDGNSADYWSSTVKNLNVHYSSGPANHFFYLLSEGSGTKTINGVSYTSPTYNGATLTGVGRGKAAAIWYRALTTYFTSSTGYSAARTGTLRAATDLYGSGSTEYNAVAAAWTAINVA